MAKEYKVGADLFLPVRVKEINTEVIIGKSVKSEVRFSYVYCFGESREGAVLYGGPSLLLTAEEIYANRWTADRIEHLTDMLDYGRQKYDEIEELKSRNAELEALLKEVTATRDEAIRQNNELIADRNNWKEAAQKYHDSAKVADKATEELRAENKKLKAAADKIKDTIVDRTKDVQNLTEACEAFRAENDALKAELDIAKNTAQEWHDKAHQTAQRMDGLRTDISDLRAELDEAKGANEELKAKATSLQEENGKLKAWYDEANKTASEAAEANDELRSKVSDLRNRVGEQLAQIQDLNAEIHFLKAERDKFAKTAKDKADLANKACDERNDAQGDLVTAKAAIDYLQEENKKLKQEHKDVEAAHDVVAETSIKRKNRITTMEEVIVALVEKIRRLESDD